MTETNPDAAASDAGAKASPKASRTTSAAKELANRNRTSEKPSGDSERVRIVAPVLILLLMLLAIGLTRVISPDTLLQFMTSLIAPLAALVGMAIWLFFFSRIPLHDRGMLAATLAIALIAGSQIMHLSMVPIGIIIYGLPVMMLIPVVWILLVPGPFSSVKRIGAYAALVMPAILFVGLRIDGISGSMNASISYRWKPSAEQQYLAALADTTDADKAQDKPGKASGSAQPMVADIGDWPEFRGPDRNGIAQHTSLAEDWTERAFEELWRRPIGPGWSSFIAVGNRLFTQEQRGEEEAIVCLNANTGGTIWVDTTEVRFYEVVGNAGPRATPTFDSGRIYALGATGRLTALDAVSGKRIWQSDMAADTGAQIPTWGFSSSPLVVDGNKVIVIAGEPGTKVIAYDADNGQVLWKSLEKGLSYSSPQLMVIDGERQVVVMDGDGVFSLNPDSGNLLWAHLWPIRQAARIVQPLMTDANTLLIGTGYGKGTRKLTVKNGLEGWQVEEVWTSRDMKPYFNDFVFHEGFLYGFDHEIIACIDVESGDRMWKKGRYGFGQMLLVPQSDVLIVLGEKGELALLKATPEKSEATEIRKFQALEGKTWNHPVLVENRLYVRNAQEAACFELAGSVSRAD